MKRLMLAFAMISGGTYAQEAPGAYFDLIKQADSLFGVKEFGKAASVYSAAFRAFGDRGYIPDRYHAACAWAMAGAPDSAFFNLERIVTRGKDTGCHQLITDTNLAALHADTRWLHLLKVVAENKEENEEIFRLNGLLDSMVTEDQKWRKYHIRLNNNELESDTLTEDVVMSRMYHTDSLNYYLLKEIFSKYGFPNYDLVGPEGSNRFWLLVQHQGYRPAFQDSVLKAMKIEVDQGKASSRDYAYLLDRVNVIAGGLQIYGTQMQLNADSTSYEPLPVTDPECLNERRKSVGLDSIEAYIHTMNTGRYGILKRK